MKFFLIILLHLLILPSPSHHQSTRRRNDERPKRHKHNSDLSMWIDEQQVKRFSGFPMEIQIITDGSVQQYLLDPNFETFLPVIPSEVGMVNFTWKAGEKKYFYNFDRLQSYNEDVLLSPILSIDTRGKIPRKPKSFSVLLPCSGKASGIASFIIGLIIETRKGRPLQGTPLRFRLRKECIVRGGPDPEFSECDKKCANGGWCTSSKVCHCKAGYMGTYCQTALCFPACLNGGICVSPGTCDCPTGSGWLGLYCEGGICREKCLNGGKCIGKDLCDCPKGYYGLRCEFSKCMIPCLNGGKCRGVNSCRCSPGFSGEHCEIELTTSNRSISQRHTCSLPCRHGTCISPNKCECEPGWQGKRCARKVFV